MTEQPLGADDERRFLGEAIDDLTRRMDDLLNELGPPPGWTPAEEDAT